MNRDPDRRGPSADRNFQAVAVSLAFALCAVSAASLWLQHRDDTRMPSRAELQPVAERIHAERQAGDWVRTLPTWFHRSREVLGDQPYLNGAPLDPLERHLVERIWYVAENQAQAEPDRSWTPEISWFLEGPRVSLGLGVVAPGPDVLWDGWSALEDARVRRGERACTTWIDDGHHCGAYNEFLFVGRAIREMDEQPRRCISANAPDRGDAWTITWSDVPRGETLRVRAGNTFDAVRALRGSDVEFSVALDGAVVLEERFDPNAIGYPMLEASVPASAEETVEVTITVRAEDHFDRFFCFRPQMTSARSI